jgi:hypothetical protein
VGLLCFSSGLAQARSPQLGPSTLYRLEEQSTYQQGCFPPCECPLSEQAPVRGTFLLTPVRSPSPVTTFLVQQVNGLVASGDRDLRLVGEGTYQVGGEVALQQRLILDLQSDKGTVQHFDSGWVALEAKWPTLALTISLNGEHCLDTVITVRAAPVPAAQIHPYRLQSGSTVQQGCFPPCACPLGAPQPLRGSFALVELSATPLFREFAVVQVNWRVAGAATPLPSPIRGSGFYRVGGEVAVLQQLSLDLRVGATPVQHFDSGLVSGGGDFPVLDITISLNGLHCFDTAIHVHALPSMTSAGLR